jgi:hypothetical protein
MLTFHRFLSGLAWIHNRLSKSMRPARVTMAARRRPAESPLRPSR